MGDKVDIGVDVRIVPPVVLGDRVKIGDHATVGPYAVVGARANIGRDANVTHSIITEGARVDGGAVISRRLVAKKCHLEI
jgi:mannose-1-phosphate guanylyltransferase